MIVHGKSRQSGSLMTEVLLATTILSLGILSFMGAFLSNNRAVDTVNELDEVYMALNNVAETLKGQDFSQLYNQYYGTTFPVPNLTGPNGNQAYVEPIFYTSETALPPEFGPLQDLDAAPSNLSADTSTSYRMLPVELRLNYTGVGGEARTHKIFLVFGSDAGSGVSASASGTTTP